MKHTLNIFIPLFVLSMATWLAFNVLGSPLDASATVVVVVLWAAIVLAVRYLRSGDPRNAGRIGVGPVCYGAKFNHEFSPSAEDQPTWDSGPKAASFSTSFAIMPRPVSGKLPCKRDSPRVACIGCDRRWPAAISIPSRGFGKP